MSSPKSYILKLFMPGAKLYRVMEVPGDATLDELHDAIHEYMEFPTYEMYAFFPDNKLMSAAGYYAPQMRKRSAASVRLEQLHLRVEQRFLYVYDMAQIKQFYIRVEEIRDGYAPEIRLLRKNGKLPSGIADKVELEEIVEEDTWRVRGVHASMVEMLACNEIEALYQVAYTINLEVQEHWNHEELAEAIEICLHADEPMVLRMLPVEMLRMLESIWRTEDEGIIKLPYEYVLRFAMMGFLNVVQEDKGPVIEYSVFASEWIRAILETPNNLMWLETYMQWSAVARGLIRSYGIIHMDDFYHLISQYLDMQLDVDEACEFVMQRLEWNDLCHAIEVDDEWYWSIAEQEAARKILKRRQLYDLEFKPLTYKEILANAESAGWQHVDCAQELFAALQGMAKNQEENKEMLTGIVEAMAVGLEPHEVMDLCLPPVSKVGRPLYSKIRQILRKIRRQLPDFGLMGYTEEEAERMFPDQKSTEGFVVIKGSKNTN